MNAAGSIGASGPALSNGTMSSLRFRLPQDQVYELKATCNPFWVVLAVQGRGNKACIVRAKREQKPCRTGEPHGFISGRYSLSLSLSLSLSSETRDHTGEHSRDAHAFDQIFG
jgi:hypothetical protein